MIDTKNHVVFDLDDTLYKEIDFVKSAYQYINRYLKNKYALDLGKYIDDCVYQRRNFFDIIKENLKHSKGLTDEKYLELYRFHFPKISLDDGAKGFIEELKNKGVDFSIITDGRSISQRNKINALGLTNDCSNIIISEETGFEKPNFYNFNILNGIYTNKKLVYIADNTSKDFLAPNILKWDTICLLDNGQNVHKQNFDLEFNYLPKLKINNFKELIV